MSAKLVLIDGHSIIHRAFYGIPDLTNSEGIHTNAVYGFLNILFKVLEEEKPDYLTVAFDVHAPTFRHEMFKEYKGTRKPMPEELRGQVPLLKEVLMAMGITVIEKAGLEADDLIGTLSHRYSEMGLKVTVVSGDRDLLQLATGDVLIRIPKTKGGKTVIEDYDDKGVMELYGVTPRQFIDVKALMGDASDNIPGVPGIGEKTAVKIITEFGDLENAIANVERIKPPRASKNLGENIELARLSRKLAEIEINADLYHDLKSSEIGNIYTHEAYEVFKRLGFKNFLSRFDFSAGDVTQDTEIVVISGASELRSILAGTNKEAGFVILGDETCVCLSMAFEDIRVFADLRDEKKAGEILSVLSEDLKTRRSYTFDLKEQLFYCDFSEENLPNDLIIGAYLCNPLKSDYSADDISVEYLNNSMPSYKELFNKLSVREAFEKDPDNLRAYGVKAAECALLAGNPVLNKIDELGMGELYKEIELPLVPVLFRMEKSGIYVAREELKEYGEKLSEGIDKLEQSIFLQAGEEFNINSPKQLGVVLFEKLGMPSGKKTKTGYSTAAGVLEKLAEDYPLVNDILNYRQLTKLKSTYADGLAAFIKADGRIHCKFHQTITATGRISSTEPNMQNIPIRMELGRLIRKVFIPQEGFVFVDADYSQAELRIMASMSGDEELISAYNTGKDIHRITASQVFGVPFEEVDDTMRRNAKAVNFGIIYGQSSFGLSQGLSITRKEADQYIKSYFKTYPKVKAYLDETVAFAKENGYVKTMFGRIRPIPELSSGNFMQRSFGERVAMNSPIQGTAADIMKVAMIKADKMIREKNLKSRILLQVHDELLVETARDEVYIVKDILEEAMGKAVILRVPLLVDAHEGDNWMEAK